MAHSQHDINNKIKHHVHAANRTAKAGRLDRHSVKDTNGSKGKKDGNGRFNWGGVSDDVKMGKPRQT